MCDNILFGKSFLNFCQLKSVNGVVFECFSFVSLLKILERQSKLQRIKIKDEKVEDSDTEETGGLFDD